MGVVKRNAKSTKTTSSSGSSTSSSSSASKQYVSPKPAYVPTGNETEITMPTDVGGYDPYEKADSIAAKLKAAATRPADSTGTSVEAPSATTSGAPTFSESNRTKSYYSTLSDIEDDDPGSFSMSSATKDYYNTLKGIEASKPADFESKYTQNIDALLNTIQNPEAFDLNTNDTYKQLYNNYAESYMAQGNRAARDAAGAVAALSGGYGSSYATNAASQAYDNYLQALNDQNVNLYNMALSDYWNNRNDKYNQLNAVNNQDAVDYGRYRDQVGDWKDDRNYYANQYQDFYGNDYQAYRDAVGDWQADRAYYANQANNGWNQDYNLYGSDLSQYNNDRNYDLQAAQDEYQKQMDEINRNYQYAQDYLSGIDSKALTEALANGDTETAANLRQQALAYQQAVAAASGSGSGSGGSGRRSSGGSKSSGNSSNNQYGWNDGQWQDFAENIGLALNSGSMSNDEAAAQVERAVNAGNYSYEAGQKILDWAGINWDAYEARKNAKAAK